jgi:predicted nucleic acid-binding protein
MIFLDSNVLLYVTDVDERKALIAQKLLLSNPSINSQVIVEVLNVCRREYKYSKDDLLNLWGNLVEDCKIIPITYQTHLKAIELVKKHRFQLFDSIIVASSLEAGCEILYSEDMQNGLIIERKLTIINPFI